MNSPFKCKEIFLYTVLFHDTDIIQKMNIDTRRKYYLNNKSKFKK